jgi:SNF2 family DNA or RNA helicase
LLTAPHEKVIIWTSFRDNVFTLQQRLSDLNPVLLIGGMSRENLMESANRFQTDDDCRVLIAIPACAREGFTLTKARYAIYLDRNFSALDWLQSQDRIHRFSQDRDVKVFLVEAENTLDQRIEGVLERKESMQAYILGDNDVLTQSAYISFGDIQNVLKN